MAGRAYAWRMRVATENRARIAASLSAASRDGDRGRGVQNPLAQLSPFDINWLGKEERRKYSRAPLNSRYFIPRAGYLSLARTQLLREDDEDDRMAPPPLWGKSTSLSLNRQRPWVRCER